MCEEWTRLMLGRVSAPELRPRKRSAYLNNGDQLQPLLAVFEYCMIRHVLLISIFMVYSTVVFL